MREPKNLNDLEKETTTLGLEPKIFATGKQRLAIRPGGHSRVEREQPEAIHIPLLGQLNNFLYQPFLPRASQNATAAIDDTAPTVNISPHKIFVMSKAAVFVPLVQGIQIKSGRSREWEDLQLVPCRL